MIGQNHEFEVQLMLKPGHGRGRTARAAIIIALTVYSGLSIFTSDPVPRRGVRVAEGARFEIE